MDSVTIVLPLQGFGPLYALAKAGGPKGLADARRVATLPWKALLDPSLDGFTDFTVDR